MFYSVDFRPCPTSRGRDGWGQLGHVGQCWVSYGAPGVVGVDVGKGDDGAASERAHLLFAELGFAAGGEPDVFWHEGCADDGGLFAFDKGDAASRVLREA